MSTQPQIQQEPQMLDRDMAVIKMENEVVMAEARSRGRDLPKILAEVMAQVVNFRTFAENAIYVKPCGKDPDTGKEKFARGLSIRVAQTLKAAYGWSKVRCDMLVLDHFRVKMIAVFTDYITGSVFEMSSIISRSYRAKGGKVMEHGDDRFYNVVVKAEQSKLIREVILRSIPEGLKSELWECIENQQRNLLTPEVSKQIVAKFSAKSVSQQQIERFLGKRIEVLTRDDRQRLLEIWNAIEQDEATIAEVFGETDDDGTPAPTDKLAALTARTKASRQAMEAPTAASPTPVAEPEPPPADVTQPIPPTPESPPEPTVDRAELQTAIRELGTSLLDHPGVVKIRKDYRISGFDGLSLRKLTVPSLTALHDALTQLSRGAADD